MQRGILLRYPAPGWAQGTFTSLFPGAHAVVFGAYHVLLEAETSGFEVRDSITVIGPQRHQVWLLRKPIEETNIVAQVLKTGTGAIWVDGCRVGAGTLSGSPAGRWPSNLVFVHDIACRPASYDIRPSWVCASSCRIPHLDAQSGVTKSSNDPNRFKGTTKFKNGHYVKDGDVAAAEMQNDLATTYGDEGGASRYFMQFANETELDAWLLRLILGDP